MAEVVIPYTGDIVSALSNKFRKEFIVGGPTFFEWLRAQDVELKSNNKEIMDMRQYSLHFKDEKSYTFFMLKNL